MLSKIQATSNFSPSSKSFNSTIDMLSSTSISSQVKGSVLNSYELGKYKTTEGKQVPNCPCDSSHHYETILFNEVIDLPVQFLFMALFYNSGISNDVNLTNVSCENPVPLKVDDLLISEFRKYILASRGIIGQVCFLDSISDDSFSLFDDLRHSSVNIPNNTEDKAYPILNLKYMIPINNSLGMFIFS